MKKPYLFTDTTPWYIPLLIGFIWAVLAGANVANNDLGFAIAFGFIALLGLGQSLRLWLKQRRSSPQDR